MRKSLKKNIFGFKIHRVYLATTISLSILNATFSYVLKINPTLDIIGFVLDIFIIAGIVIFLILKSKKEKLVVFIGIIIAILGALFSGTHFVLAQNTNLANEDFRNLSNEMLFASMRVSDTHIFLDM